jgi:hypothetical protein
MFKGLLFIVQHFKALRFFFVNLQNCLGICIRNSVMKYVFVEKRSEKEILSLIC